MVRNDGGGPLMKIVGRWHSEAHCIWIDTRGSIHSQYFEMDQLSPFWLSTSPRSLWPDVSQIAEIEEQDTIVLPAGRHAAKARKANRQNRRSNKIRRRVNVAA